MTTPEGKFALDYARGKGFDPERYKEARRQNEKDEASLRVHLLMAAGYTAGGGNYGQSSAIEVAFKRLFPDEKFPELAP